MNQNFSLNESITVQRRQRKRYKSSRCPWGEGTYAEIIEKAILSKADKRMRLKDIYDYLINNYDYFARKSKVPECNGWKNSVRHNLSLHTEIFAKHQSIETGKSSWWTVKDNECIDNYDPNLKNVVHNECTAVYAPVLLQPPPNSAYTEFANTNQQFLANPIAYKYPVQQSATHQNYDPYNISHTPYFNNFYDDYRYSNNTVPHNGPSNVQQATERMQPQQIPQNYYPINHQMMLEQHHVSNPCDQLTNTVTHPTEYDMATFNMGSVFDPNENYF